MDFIPNSPGLHHIFESICRCLDKKSILHCREVNSSWKYVLDNKTFWMKMLKLTPWSNPSVVNTYEKNIRQLQLELQRQLQEEINKESIQWKFNSSEVRKNYLTQLTKAVMTDHNSNAEFIAKYYELKAFYDAKNLEDYDFAIANHLVSIIEKTNPNFEMPKELSKITSNSQKKHE